MTRRFLYLLFASALFSVCISSCSNRALRSGERTSYYYGPSPEWQNYTGGYNPADYNNAAVQLQGVLDTPPECINCQTNCDNSSDSRGISHYRFTR